AVRLAEESRNQTGVAEKLLQLANDPDERVQFQLACTLGRFIVAPAGEGPLAGARGSNSPQSSSRMQEGSDASAERVFQALYQIALRHIDDSWFQIAVFTSASQTAEQLFHSLTSQKEFTVAPGK